jgi:replicative DNA helicase
MILDTIETTRAPAWSAEAEQSVLGALLQDATALADLGLSPADFFDARHRAIFGAMQIEAAAKRTIDPVSLFAALQGEDAGGLQYLEALEQSVPSARSVKRHAEIVGERSRSRALVRAMDEATALAHEAEPVAERIERIAALIAGLQREQVAKLPRSISEIAIARTGYYEDLQEGRVEPGWATRIPTLDEMLVGGLRPGGLYILAARPKVGKSSFAQQMAMAMAKAGRPTLFLSQEMSAEELADRAVVNAGRLDYSKLLAGKMDKEDWSRATDALDHMAGMPLYIDDQPGLTIHDIRAKARIVPGLKVLVLDYLQLSASKLTDSNRNAQIEEISRGLKCMAKDRGIAVIALSQLNREVEKRANKRPQLSDLRDSGAIEQDADAVLFLWPARDLGQGRRLIGLAVEANRQGRCGCVGLEFDGNLQRWGESMMSVEAPATAHKGGGYE